jgi:transcription elongation factor GreB
VSRAFVKEDVDPPERSGRVRTASGLPPGATNYITATGAKRLRDELEQLRGADAKDERVAHLQRVLGSVQIVETPSDPQSIAFGARVTVRDVAGQLHSYRIVGVDELQFDTNAVSWISPIGKTLLAAEPGERVTLESDERVEIVKVEYPRE